MSASAAAGPILCGSRSIASVALVVSLLSACAAFARQPVQQWSVGQRPGVLAEAEDAPPSLSRIASGRAARHAPTPPQAEVPPPSPPPGAPPSPLSEAGPAATGALASTQRPSACEAWCDLKYIGAHCQKRKCHGCAFCRPSPPTVSDPTTPPHEQRPQSDGAPPTQGGGGSELQRPESECLSSAEDGGPPSFDLVALILSSNQPGPEPERRRHAVRNSWAREGLRLGGPGADAPPCSLRFLFVIGGAAAAQLRGDELALPVEDGYRSLSYKVVGAMRWLLASLAFKFALKTDDDSFVCVARLLEQVYALPRTRVYLGAISKKRKVITDPSHAHFERWGDRDYVALFNRSVYAAYMQGAGYVLSSDLVATVARRAAPLPRLPAIEDALIGTLLEGDATPTNRPAAIRYKNRDEYAVTVCEKDTEFALVHKLSVDDLRRCKQATQRRRSPRCPKGPCVCRTLGQTLRRPKLFVDSFTRAEELRESTKGESVSQYHARRAPL